MDAIADSPKTIIKKNKNTTMKKQTTPAIPVKDEIFTANENILLERDYDSKIWSIAGDNFDRQNPDHYSDGTTDRTSHTLSEKEAGRLNSMIDGDGCVQHIGIILTKTGIRLTSF